MVMVVIMVVVEIKVVKKWWSRLFRLAEGAHRRRMSALVASGGQEATAAAHAIPASIKGAATNPTSDQPGPFVVRAARAAAIRQLWTTDARVGIRAHRQVGQGRRQPLSYPVLVTP